MTNIEILRSELNKEEYSISLMRRVNRLGGIDGISEEDAENLVKRFDLEPKKEDLEESAYYEYKRTVARLKCWLRSRAEIGEAHLGKAWLYISDGDAEAVERIASEISRCIEDLKRLYPMACNYASWLGVKLDTTWRHNR